MQQNNKACNVACNGVCSALCHAACNAIFNAVCNIVRNSSGKNFGEINYIFDSTPDLTNPVWY